MSLTRKTSEVLIKKWSEAFDLPPFNKPGWLIFRLKALYSDQNSNPVKFPEKEEVQGGYIDENGFFHKDEE